MTDPLARLYRPKWTGGWTLARWLFIFACAHGHLPRVLGIPDAYCAPDMVFYNSISSLNDYIFVTPELAFGFWGVGVLGLVMMAFGGLNVKAHDRLALFMAIAFMVAPLTEHRLTQKYRSPIGRYFMLLIFCIIYFETGLMKLLYEPSWRGSGEVLAYHLVHPFHGNTALGAWLSGQPLLMAPMAWFTLVFELSFPLLVVFRKTNGWILLAGALFHFVLLMLMDVGSFGYVSLAAYPVLLHPEIARSVWERARPFIPSRAA